ncbi:aspartic peptidase domain-containing protein [Thelonectria olida]|uniref:Aspartic peptidase domain-containing protein n=1 Tax=Thelonectria olida TaxID=1576542 RepID=A0A9P8WBU6_9HYPO|nr:aspartic peptidase domain-containing protein [Thelonectria olida]
MAQYDDSTGGIGLDGGLDGLMLGLDLEGESGTRYMDDMSLNGITVENSQKIKYPGGRTSPFFAGCLSLGGNRATNQSFTQANTPATNASLPPGWMWENEWTSSNSFGMHIGSVQPAMSGSLWFGGYDQNRIIGDILSLSGGPRDGITLWDIGIDVIGSKSPFDFESNDDLLATGNSCIGSGLDVSIDGCSPYMTLPRSTCANIAANLPVRFDEDLGLYLWNTTSDKYNEIITSATALTFSFISSSNTDPVKIRVPFMHLNLTLSAPLLDIPTPYFPCHVNGKGEYVLGRVFLQDAFIGANWHPDANTWWLAQAPGRSIQATSNIGGNDWKASWSGVWDDESEPSNTPTSDSTNKETNKEGEESGMSTGAKAGIAIGAVGALLAVVLGAFFWFRRRNQTRASQTVQTTPSEATSPMPSKLPLSELPNHEMEPNPSPYQRYELPS